MKSFIRTTILICCLMGLACPTKTDASISQDSSAVATTTPVVQVRAKKVSKTGEVLLACPYSKLKKKKMKHCDIVRVSTDSISMDIPICDKRTDVNLRAAYIRWDKATGNVYLSMNHGKFAKKYNINKGTKISLQCVKKNGYYEEYKAHQYVISDRRKDYKNDCVFANFREVSATGIAPKTLYRSGNPLHYKDSPNRSYYCAKLMKKYKIKSVVNMSNTKKEMKAIFKKKPTSTSYYKKLWMKKNVYYGQFTTDMTSDAYMTPVISALRFMIDAPAPYMIHCNMGKDRTGYLCALLMALTGSSYEEIVDEYMTSFENYYGIKAGTKRWEIIADGNIRSLLAESFITNEWAKANPSQAATNYLKKYGMSDREIETLKKKLAGE